jgi:hypothetical protein
MGSLQCLQFDYAYKCTILVSEYSILTDDCVRRVCVSACVLMCACCVCVFCVCMCVRACMCVCARARARACMHARVHACTVHAHVCAKWPC